MNKAKFSVHKQTVMANRIGFRMWANKNNKGDLIPGLDSRCIDLDAIVGDRVPLDIITSEVRRAAELANEANLGLKVIELVDIRITSLGMAIRQALLPLQQQELSLPLDRLLRLVGRYFQILSEVVGVEVAEVADGVVVSFNPCAPDDVSYHQVEGAVYGLVKLINSFDNSMPERINFSHVPDSLDYSIYQHCFGCLPQFSTAATQLFYRTDVCSEGDTLPLLLSPLVQLHEKQFPHINYAERIRLLLLTTLGFVEPTRDNIAGIMNVSVSSLQRRLRVDGVNFNQLLLAVRQQLVKKYLLTAGMTSEKLAFLLGYKAKSQFLKAFRQWFDMTPKQFREKLVLEKH